MPRSLGLDLAKPLVETFSADWQLAQVFLIKKYCLAAWGECIGLGMPGGGQDTTEGTM